MSEVLIVPTGSANLASVQTAFQRLGIPSRVAMTAFQLGPAEFVVLPGVGSFEAGMQGLQQRGFVEPLRQRIERGKRTLAICLGFQLLGEASDESPGVGGLGIWPTTVRRLPPSPLLPQMGWNGVSVAGTGLLESGQAYYANSYAFFEKPEGWRTATSLYGKEFVAAVEKAGVLACQFHPELSGSWGEDLLRRWLAGERVDSDDIGLEGPRPCRVIPCLDVRGGRVVKGVRFQNLRDAGDPSEQAARYAAEGADELVMLDVSATLEEREAAALTVKSVRSGLNIPLTVGGGVRSDHDAARLLEAGADKVGINSAAVESPDLISCLAERFGRQCVVIAVDAARSSATPSGYEVVVRSGSQRTGIDAVDWCAEAAARGAGEILLTSWDQDGTRSGYELSLISHVAQKVKVPLIASGGAARPGDLVDAVRAGADGVLAASIFHDRDLTVSSLKLAMREQGVAVR